jgi:hypothetical protein
MQRQTERLGNMQMRKCGRVRNDRVGRKLPGGPGVGEECGPIKTPKHLFCHLAFLADFSGQQRWETGEESWV